MQETTERRLIEILRDNGEMRLADICACFPNLDYHTVCWYLNRAVKRGRIVKVARASYAASTDSEAVVHAELSENARRVARLLEENGYGFYISGLDCFPKGRFSFSGDFPTIICTRPECTCDVQMLLMRELELAMRAEDVSNIRQFYGDVRYYILPSTDDHLSLDGFACQEKAFCDLYFCITRMGYPLDLEQLVRILGHIDINRSRFLSSTREDKVQDELNFITGYRPDFLLPFADYVRSRNNGKEN